MDIQTVYTSVACNPTPESLDWGYHDMVVYAASNAAVIYDAQLNRVVRTIVRHKARVNTAKWVQPQTQWNQNTAVFVTGADDCICVVHRIVDVRDARSAVLELRLVGHTGGVKIVDTVRLADGALIVATAASDASLKLWRCNDDRGDDGPVDVDDIECFQTIEFNADLCLALRLCVLPWAPQQDSIVMAVGAGDKVQIYSRRSQDTVFAITQTLTGHEDWVRGLDFHVSPGEGEAWLASSAQDSFIRLWRAGADTDGGASFGLESVLSGHDGWVYSVQWSIDERPEMDGRLQLLSSSMDKTMILWQPSSDDGIWMETVRVGDIGGHFLGFFGAKMAPSGRALIGHGYHGSFHLWQLDEQEQRWRPGVMGAGGHFGEARDVAWEPRGRFALSVSADQTTRVHAPCSGSGTQLGLWHELARPQVHGYDMQAIAVLGLYRFASGAEEKIVRTFQAPSGFVQSLRAVCGVQSDDDAEGERILSFKSKGATLPSLGLSNQATIETGSESNGGAIDATGDVDLISSDPPTEETLMQNTLWPETQKLYGHGYEVYSLCATNDGKLLASACKATNTEHAQIILWNTHTWKQHQHLVAHQLTITQMRFSPDDRHLLSVSRDRRWSVFERTTANGDQLAEYALRETTNKQNGVHGRIIWTCDWSPDSQYFATGSRDGKCVMWHAVDEQHPRNATSTLERFTAVDVLNVPGDSVTAIAFATRALSADGGYLVAIGTDAGSIWLCRFAANEWRKLTVLSTSEAHHGTVRKLAFRPRTSVDEITDRFQLASCGNDNVVKVYEISGEY